MNLDALFDAGGGGGGLFGSSDDVSLFSGGAKAMAKKSAKSAAKLPQSVVLPPKIDAGNTISKPKVFLLPFLVVIQPRSARATAAAKHQRSGTNVGAYNCAISLSLNFRKQTGRSWWPQGNKLQGHRV